MPAHSARSFPAHPSSLGEIRAYLRELVAGTSMSDRAADDLILAVSEACANAVLHSGSDRVELACTMTEDFVEVQVRDFGSFKRRVRVPEIERPGGYGIPLMVALTDQVEIEEGTHDRPGTSVRLVKRRATRRG